MRFGEFCGELFGALSVFLGELFGAFRRFSVLSRCFLDELFGMLFGMLIG